MGNKKIRTVGEEDAKVGDGSVARVMGSYSVYLLPPLFFFCCIFALLSLFDCVLYIVGGTDCVF